MPSTGAVVVQAGTALDAHGRLVSAGGRVLAVVGTGDDLEQARAQAYAGIGMIDLAGSFYRTDIAAGALPASGRSGMISNVLANRYASAGDAGHLVGREQDHRRAPALARRAVRAT